MLQSLVTSKFLIINERYDGETHEMASLKYNTTGVMMLLNFQLAELPKALYEPNS
jgi:hypothetical protein